MNLSLEQSLINREKIISNVREEMIGPSTIQDHWAEFNPIGNAVLPKVDTPFFWTNGGKKEEILQYQGPTQRYVSGMLFPIGVRESEMESLETPISSESSDEEKKEILLPENGEVSTEEIGDMELFPQKNDYMPSSLGLTFCLEKSVEKVSVKISGGTYDPQIVKIESLGKTSTWWMRSSLQSKVEVNLPEVLNSKGAAYDISMYDATLKNIHRLKLQLQVLVREVVGKHIVTISLTNRSQKQHTGSEANEQNQKKEQLILFQAAMEVSVPESESFSIYPSRYDLVSNNIQGDDSYQEELSMELLYRKNGNYAFGHGCSVHWEQNSQKVKKIETTFLPEYQAVSMTPDIQTVIQGKLVDLKILMADLAGITDKKDPEIILGPLISSYQEWIESKKIDLDFLPDHLKLVGQRHLELCMESQNRMVSGLKLLKDPQTLKAFQLANLSILLQQQNGIKKRNGTVVDGSLLFDLDIDKSFNNIQALSKSENSWRAFQIAFILMSIESFVDETSKTRDIVDLIWFPTGGGKTEAYLGTAAFHMILRRLKNPNDASVDVIMRYTLRLLTADQFQRSSRLMCALEYIRKQNTQSLGETPFSIGIWVGSSTTPNTNKDAKKQLMSLQKDEKSASHFVVNNCPWCGAKMGFYNEQKNKKKRHYYGFKIEKDSLVLHCPDRQCEFHDELPIYIVDESIYKKRPTFLIGTVDKFVRLVWEPKARLLFGLNEEGDREYNPPSLIVQDELHLISGPLGTLTGLFEVLVEELCIKKVKGRVVKPKIIAATATIKQFEEQTKALFGRNTARLFPSPGLESDDSFFARPALDPSGTPMPGRKYVGVYTTTVRIMMSQVMTFSSIIQSTSEIKANERDPYWTLLAFYNTLRELGGGLTLTQMDISQYSNSMAIRKGTKKSLRYLNNVLELTSRKQSQEISKAIDDLKTSYVEPVKTNNKKMSTNVAMDVCLASNIIEVGVDIDRLSVMAIVGQPKMTAQYIQVSGRVGRRWWERPGLIFTLYSNTKSRDKSHFEHFREYHEKLYAQVEPTSVTPFSDASLEKGLTGIIVGYLRQAMNKELGKVPSARAIADNMDKIKEFTERIIERAEMVDPEQVPVLKQSLKRILTKLIKTPYSSWEVKGDANGFMYQAGTIVPQIVERESVAMINSLRTVDSECRGMITSLYNELPSEDEEVEGLEFLN